MINTFGLCGVCACPESWPDLGDAASIHTHFISSFWMWGDRSVNRSLTLFSGSLCEPALTGGPSGASLGVNWSTTMCWGWIFVFANPVVGVSLHQKSIKNGTLSSLLVRGRIVKKTPFVWYTVATFFSLDNALNKPCRVGLKRLPTPLPWGLHGFVRLRWMEQFSRKIRKDTKRHPKRHNTMRKDTNKSKSR